LRSSHPEIEEEFKNMPRRIKVAKNGRENELLVFVKKGKDLFVGYKSYDENYPRAVTFEEVYDKIIAEPEDPPLPLSDGFWKNYHIILDKTKYKFSLRVNSNPNELSNKAKNLLRTLLGLNPETLKPHYKFISDLIEDLEDYGTLSEYAISEIVEWEKYLNNGDKEKLITAIEELKREIGEDFLERAMRHLKEVSNEVIIAIENQKGGNER